VTPEGKVKAEVKKILTTYGAYWFCPVQNGMGAPGLDFHCCYRGVAFFIETKAPGKRPTPRQQHTIKQMKAAGGKCFVIDGQDRDPQPGVLPEVEGYAGLIDFLQQLSIG